MRLDKAILKAPKLELETQTRNNVIIQSSLSIGGIHWRLGPRFAGPDTPYLECALANSIILALLFYSTPYRGTARMVLCPANLFTLSKGFT